MASTHMKLAIAEIMDETGSRLVYGQKVSDIVESWNWNLNIFEIYDEIRDYSDSCKEALLTYAYYFFNEDKMMKELASHFGIYSIEE
jgi:hypothetical protein